VFIIREARVIDEKIENCSWVAECTVARKRLVEYKVFSDGFVIERSTPLVTLLVPLLLFE